MYGSMSISACDDGKQSREGCEEISKQTFFKVDATPLRRIVDV